MTTIALSQLGRRFGVPTRSGSGQITASNASDGQAMQDSTGAMWSTLLSGGHQVWHAAGWLEGGLVMSYEKFIMDLDLAGLAIDHDDMLNGGESILRDSEVIWTVNSPMYSRRLNKSLALAHVVPVASETGTKLTIQGDGAQYHATVVAMPIYDPEMTKAHT